MTGRAFAGRWRSDPAAGLILRAGGGPFGAPKNLKVVLK